MKKAAQEKPTSKSSGSQELVQLPVLPLLRANRFDLVDSAGKTRGGFGFSDQGYPILALVDDRSDGLTIRAELSLSKEGPALCLSDSAGVHRALLSVKDSGSAALALNDAKGRLRVCLIVDNGGVIVRTFDSQLRPWRFVQEPRRRRSLAQTVKALEKAANQDGKRGFIRAIGEVLDITDTAQIDSLWKDAVKRDARKVGVPKPPKAA